MPLAKPTRIALDADQIMQAKLYPDRWLPAAFKIAPEDTTDADVVNLIPTPIQRTALGSILKVGNRYNYVIKHRQAKLSTLCCGVLLNKVMYSPAKKGLLIANDEKTAKVLFDRIKFGYRNMPQQIRIDLEVENAESIQWPTHNDIRVVTGGGKTPAIGNSPDLYVVTEFGEYQDQGLFNKHFFPAVMKRPGSWGVIETTPGKHGSVAHDMWLRSMNGDGFMSGCFLEWWKDDTCVAEVPDGFRPTQEELVKLNKYPGMTYGHLMFRRRICDSGIFRDPDLEFPSKYPDNPLEGWLLGDGRPAMPKEPIQRLMEVARKCRDFEETTYEAPESGEMYLVTCDPNSYGRSGDPSSIKVWSRTNKREVWAFHGREDPGLLARRAIKIAKKYNNAMLMIENNKAEAIAAARGLGYEHLYWEDVDHPGWRATETTRGEAVEALVDMVREVEIDILSMSTLTQLLQWDGTAKKHGRTDDGTHHFDQVTTCYMAAWYFRQRPLPAPLKKPRKEEPAEGESWVIKPMTWKDVEAHRKRQQKARTRNVLGFGPRSR